MGTNSISEIVTFWLGASLEGAAAAAGTPPAPLLSEEATWSVPAEAVTTEPKPAAESLQRHNPLQNKGANKQSGERSAPGK